MDFFESQDRSRRKTRYLLFLMTLAVIGVITAVTGTFALVGWLSSAGTAATPFLVWIQSNIQFLSTIAFLAIIFIGSSSLYRIFSLRNGGAQVARNLGGTIVGTQEKDPIRKRLRNVVEEMAIASGVPVPEIYVLEHEAGINAFAAGYGLEDAAIAVTRGTLETLDRNELQGVIAHEFSHILNGDMRLNIKLMGPLFGILSVSLVGRMLLRGRSRMRSGSRKGGGGNFDFVIVVGLGLYLAGWIGFFFGRLIRAGVSRQREYLADASAIQFTRQRKGIAGALKKIAGLSEGSAVDAVDAEEISHMLFASGQTTWLQRMLASHPPLLDRIRAIEPSFSAEQLAQLHTERINLAAEPPDERLSGFTGPPTETITTTAAAVMDTIGHPGDAHIAAARTLLAQLPDTLHDALESSDRVLLLLTAMILHPDAQQRSGQLNLLTQRFGSERSGTIKALSAEMRSLNEAIRLPLLELVLPRIKAQPPSRIAFLDELLEQIALSDNQLEIFEYALLRIFRSYMQDARQPRLKRWQNLSSGKIQRAAINLLRVYVGTTMDVEQDAGFAAGINALGIPVMRYEQPAADWVSTADDALNQLRQCVPRERERVIAALLAAALHSGRIGRRESELLRAFCALLGCPVPPVLSPR